MRRQTRTLKSMEIDGIWWKPEQRMEQLPDGIPQRFLEGQDSSGHRIIESSSHRVIESSSLRSPAAEAVACKCLLKACCGIRFRLGAVELLKIMCEHMNNPPTILQKFQFFGKWTLQSTSEFWIRSLLMYGLSSNCNNTDNIPNKNLWY